MTEELELHLTRASWDDWDTLVGLRIQAERHLRGKGLSQWDDRARGLDQLSTFLHHDEVYLIMPTLMGIPAGTVALTTRPDRDFWPDAEEGEWLYLHKAITASWARHRGVGAYMVVAALREAAERGCRGVRLDCWRGADGAGARERWEAHGFTVVGELDVHGRSSGVLMEQLLPVSTKRLP